MKQKQESIDRIGAKYEEQQFKLERDIRSKKDRISTQKTQG